MTEQQIFVETLDNGLVLLGERMDWVESAAFAIALPGGCRYDPDGREGLSNMVCDMVQRGAGERDTRQFLNDLENLGVDYSGHSSNSHMSFGGATLAERLMPAMSIFADMLRRPHLPADQLEDSRNVCYQEIASIEDDLSRRVMMTLRQRHYPSPLGRDQFGSMESVSQITLADVKQHWQRHFVPNGAIIAIAGKFDWDEYVDHAKQLYGDWEGTTVEPVATSPAPRGYLHIEHESSQTHLAIAYPAVPANHDDFYRSWAAVSVLSDGGSSRFFTEVREKRGLCYTVGASYHALENQACVQCYAGTTTERAQETLDVMMREIQGLNTGILPEELHRLKSRCKTSLIMQQESSMARSSAIAHQWAYLGRVRTLKETNDAIDALTCESIGDFVKQNPPKSFTICTLGEAPLEIPVEIS